MDIAQQIERYMRSDQQSADLFYKLKLDDPYIGKGRTSFSGLSDVDYPRHEPLGVPLFYQNMQSNFATGLLPSIMRAWMSIDSDLYLWNFETNRDLAYYDAINNTILHVDIVSPKPGFTYPSLHSILVVATTVDILLLALSFQDSGGHALSPEATAAELKSATILMVGGAPLYKLPLDGLIVNDLCTTANGRIFFAADDSLYELDYYGKGWFGTGGSCRKTNHSKRLLNYLVPVLQIFYAKDTVFQLAIDDSRHLLYVLMKSGCIQLFDLGVDGRSIQKFGALYREHIEHMGRETCNVQPELFHELVSLTPVSLGQSVNVNLIVTTSKGVRVFITCLATPLIGVEPALVVNQQQLLRPSALRVLHIRFPPETPATMPHLLNIYTAHRTHDCMLLATPGTEQDMSLLLAHSSACFAVGHRFAEHAIQLRIRGNVWKIVHFRPQKKALKDYRPSRDDAFGHSSDCPLAIEQLQCPLEKFHVITSKGIYVFEHCSPLELFRRSLTQHGMDSKQFQALASTVPAVELCTMALCVLCSDQASDQAIKDLALRVFFHFGGEPRLYYGTHGHPPMMVTDGGSAGGLRTSMGGDGYMNGTLSNTSMFLPRTPLRTSTPQQNGTAIVGGAAHMNGHTPQLLQQQQQLTTPGGTFDGDHSIVAGAQLMPSPRHEALHTLFARIVKDVWRRSLCIAQTSNNVYSSLGHSEVDRASHQLAALRRAMDEYQLTLAGGASLHAHHHSPFFHLAPSVSTTAQQKRQSGAGESNLVEQEHQSLQKLRSLVGTACEVLALWGVLLEHELQVIFVMLAPDVQKRLLCWSLEELVRGAQEVCSDLITALIRFYIGDDAVHDGAKTSAVGGAQRADIVRAAVVQLRQSIQRLNLVQTCDLLVQVHYFEGIVELALTRAQRDDPNELALVAYKKHIGGSAELVGSGASGSSAMAITPTATTSSSSAVSDAWRKRQEAYNCVLEALRLLHTLAISRGGGEELVQLQLGQCMFPAADACRSQLSPTQAELERDKLIRMVLDSDDELACVVVFQWMLGNGMKDQLIEQKPRHLESFLFHEIEAGKGAVYTEMLWKYHERSGNYLDAARVLAEMASKSSNRVNINERIKYLSHALMCVQSTPETRANTELRQAIQDKLDVAQIQLRTKALLESDAGADAEATPRGREVLDTLGYQLCSLTDLYRVANAYGLEEVKLSVLHCAGRYDAAVVEGVWRDFLQKELQQFALNRNAMDRTQKAISSQLFRLRKRYASSPQFVPLAFILRELLLFCLKNAAPTHWLLDVCREAEVSPVKLVTVASEQYRIDQFWRMNANAHKFMLELALTVGERCRDEPSQQQRQRQTIGGAERKLLKHSLLEFLAALQLNMQQQQRAGGTHQVQTQRLELLQAQLERM
uniref:Nucleoporin_N domain-containing protein n=2 Tax=Globodera pallida TaxID=36090 RepID=A0A183BK95_GLOPA